MNRPQVFIASLSIIMSACGGGSGGTSGRPTAPEAFLGITSTNAALATRMSYESAVASANMSELSGETGLFATQSGGTVKIDGGFATAGKTGNGNTGSSIPIPPTTENCDVDGTLTVSGDIADPFTPTLTAGDYFNVTFDRCDDGLGDVTDGALRLDVFAFSGDFLGGFYNLVMDIDIANLQVATDLDTLTSNGDVRVALDTTAAPYIAASVSGDSLTVDSAASAESLFDFSTENTLDAGVSPSPYTMSAAGTLDSTQLAGAVRYSTPVTFAGFDNGYPVAGELLVEGENSSARLVVLEDGSLRIDVDANGDGTVDSEVFTTWQDLQGP